MIPKTLQITGFIIIIVGFLTGFNIHTEEDKILTIFFALVGLGLISGLILIGIGEMIYHQRRIIELLEKRNNIREEVI